MIKWIRIRVWWNEQNDEDDYDDNNNKNNNDVSLKLWLKIFPIIFVCIC